MDAVAMQTAQELGLTVFLTVGVFILFVWMVKFFVTSFGEDLKAHQRQHAEMMSQQSSIISMLRRMENRL